VIFLLIGVILAILVAFLVRLAPEDGMAREIDNIWHEARRVFLPFDGVVGVGWGPKLRDGKVLERQAIVIFVDDKLAAREIREGQFIPAEFQGVPTDVRVPQLTPAQIDGVTSDGKIPREQCLPDVQWIDWPKVHRRWLTEHLATRSGEP
jgi:hypothetical protein